MPNTDKESSPTSRSTTGRKRVGRPSKEKTTGGETKRMHRKDLVFLGACAIEGARMITTRDGSPGAHHLLSYVPKLEEFYDKYEDT